MKKIILSLAAVIAASASTFAVADDATSTFVYNPATSIAGSYSNGDYGAGTTVSLGIELPEGYRQLYAGQKITSIAIPSPINSAKSNTITEATLCMSNSLNGTPFYTKEVTLSKEGQAINTFDVDPYELKADERVFIYWTIVYDGNCAYLTTDVDINRTTPPSYILTNSNLAKFDSGAWSSYASQLGALYVNVGITTDRVIDNGAEIAAVEIPDVVSVGSESNAFVFVRNLLSTPAKNVELTYTINGVEKTVTGNLQSVGSTGAVMSQAGYLALPVDPATPSLNSLVNVKVSKVNGQPNAALDASAFSGSDEFDIVVTDPDNSFDRVSVVEEGTGTWCPYCPAGIVMMEGLREKDPSTIRIAVHNADRMAIDAYQPFIREYVPGLPGSYVNRYMSVSPVINNALNYAISATEAATKGRSPFKVELEAVNNEENVQIELTAKVTCAYDYDNSDNRYQLSFVFVEDGVGPYNQANGYAYGVRGTMGGWEQKGQSVSTIYDDVARRIIGYPGVEGSLEGEFKAGEEKIYTTATTARGLTTDAIRAIAMVVDTKTGYILNAVQIPYAPAGIENVDAETVSNDAPVEYFNIQGMRVSDPVAGQIYIKRQGKEVSKIIF